MSRDNSLHSSAGRVGLSGPARDQCGALCELAAKLSQSESKDRFSKVKGTLAVLAIVALLLCTTAAAGELVSLRIENQESDGAQSFAATKLVGRDARLQLLVTGELTDGTQLDWTRKVTYSAEPQGIVDINDSALVTPLADGTVTITATCESGKTAQATLQVAGFDQNAAVSFPSQVAPIFTKLGCNGGGCHGKAAGQNGFKLSLLGFEPQSDYERLIKESRSRRISLAAPDQSLLLLKAINESPHGGGQRLEKDSHEYRLIRRWISQGMPYGSGDEPQIVSIDVFPHQRRLGKTDSQQLAVIATYSDGSSEDITRATVYESNDTEMADVTPTGLVKLQNMVGDVAVMARYQGHVTAFRADIPLGATEGWSEDQWPQPRNVIDQYVYQKLKSLGIPPAPECDDATYLRRVTLDIAGRLPTLAEVQQFGQDTSENKREALVDRLLESDDYAHYFARKWSTILRNRRSGGSLQLSNLAFHRWIRESIRENKPYDLFVRELMTASGSLISNPAVAWLKQVPDTNQRVEDAAQLFLGQRIQCARCHHHPYEKWSQKNYTQLSAFFTLVSKKDGGDPNEPVFFSRVGGASAQHPKTNQSLPPAGLDGADLAVPSSADPRAHLADWMTDPENPFFARSLANRYWKHFMGRGIVEPEDDMRVTNPPSNPELLDAMAQSFVQSGYDLKALVRMICRSRVYSSAVDANEDNLGDRRSYSRFYPKRLQAEVLLDAVDQVTLSTTPFAGMPAGTRAVELPDTGFSSYFLDVFGEPNSATACECERSQEANLAQSLHLLNSDEMQKKLSADGGRAAKLAADARGDEDKVRELYLIALSRPPRPDELSAAIKYLAAKENKREAYEDVVWTLVNSKEFMFNH